MGTKICIVCKGVVKRRPEQNNTAWARTIYCSKACGKKNYQSIRQDALKLTVDRICERCGKRYRQRVHKDEVNYNRNRWCSERCAKRIIKNPERFTVYVPLSDYLPEPLQYGYKLRMMHGALI